MQDVDRSGFESQWQGAFRGAEAQPVRDVWMAIESTLSSVENENNKRMVVMYQRIAAALALCLVVTGSLTVYKWNRSEADHAAGPQKAAEGLPPAPSTKTSEPSNQLNAAGKSSTSTTDASRTVAETGTKPVTTKVPSKKSAIQSPTVAMTVEPGMVAAYAGDSVMTNSMDRANVEGQPGDSIAVIASEPPKQLTEEEEKALVKKLLAEPEVIVEKKKTGRVWASVGAAAGSYLPDLGGGVAAAPQSFSPSPSNSISVSKSPEGTAYSIGVLVGKQIGSRFQLQAGLTYMNQRSEYLSNVASTFDNKVALFQSTAPLGAQLTSPSVPSGYVTSSYTVNSSTNYLSVPLQVGYLIVDRKIGLAVNGGLATDLFLTNTLSDASGQLQPFTQHSGDQGLYRGISFAGIGSMEVSFRLANHYQLALVPGVRYSLTNVYQGETQVNRPLIFDVGFRFRYIFR